MGIEENVDDVPVTLFRRDVQRCVAALRRIHTNQHQVAVETNPMRTTRDAYQTGNIHIRIVG